MSFRFVDELEVGFGWIEDERMGRASHALAAAGRVWVLDPVDAEGVEERVRALGEPAGVIQLLDRHNRDGAALATRLGVPLHVVPQSLPDTPFRFLPVLRSRWWKEVALWWPEHRVLALRGRARHAPVLPRRRRAGRAAPLPPAATAARVARARGRAPPRRPWRGDPRRGSRRAPSRRRCGRAGGGSRAGSPGSRVSSAAATEPARADRAGRVSAAPSGPPPGPAG